jgi:hypothetical protein
MKKRIAEDARRIPEIVGNTIVRELDSVNAAGSTWILRLRVGFNETAIVSSRMINRQAHPVRPEGEGTGARGATTP